VVGAVHGGLFLAFAALVWFTRDDLGWSLCVVALALLTRTDRGGHRPGAAPPRRGAHRVVTGLAGSADSTLQI